MEQVKRPNWPFDIPPEGVVVTTTYITTEGRPILCVTHEYDEEEGTIWQFHCGNDDYSSAVLQLVRIDEILELDPGLYELASLSLGFCAKRSAKDGQWAINELP